MIVAGVELELIRGGSGKSPSKSLGLALGMPALGSISTTRFYVGSAEYIIVI